MGLALDEARRAADHGEVPVGCVLTDASGRILAFGRNKPIEACDPTAHAEIVALRKAAGALCNYRLTRTYLVSTLEPCLMCVGALIHARVAGVVFGAADRKSGALISHLPGYALPFANHHLAVLGGVRAEECGALLSDFFARRRGAC